MSGQILQLYRDLPPITYVGPGTFTDTNEAVAAMPIHYLTRNFPTFITANLNFFLNNHTDAMLDVIVAGINLNYYNILRAYPAIVRARANLFMDKGEL